MFVHKNLLTVVVKVNFGVKIKKSKETVVDERCECNNSSGLQIFLKIT